MRRVLLAANYVMLLASPVAWFYASWIAALGGPACVTELDRHQVFQVEKLAEYNTELAENLRYNVGAWIKESERDTAVLYAYLIGAIAVVNLLGLHLLGRQSGSADPTPPSPDRVSTG